MNIICNVLLTKINYSRSYVGGVLVVYWLKRWTAES